MVRAQRQPGIGVGETSVRRLRRPGQRRACAVARQGQRPVLARLGVLDQLEGNLDLPQPQFLAIIEDDVAAQRAEQSSEEHTSELQSLMRISYAVFCLKK